MAKSKNDQLKNDVEFASDEMISDQKKTQQAQEELSDNSKNKS
jgi:hypothetical protein